MGDSRLEAIRNKINERNDRIKEVDNAVNTAVYADYDMVAWQPILSRECQVYVYNENYLAKRFDQINYKFCSKEIAREILIDNLYALLRFKYFKKRTDEIEKKIEGIVKAFTSNLKTTLIRVSFDIDTECNFVQFLPDSCIAFRNGVYDFRNNKWLFPYTKIKIDDLNNTIYMYDPSYIITWYFNIDFTPIGLDVNSFNLKELVEFLKDFNKEQKNYCFELMYNMSHDVEDKFSYERFQHLCEILGYLCMQSFSQHFVLFIGSGQNGKNSLFDGCFTPRVIPQPANNDMNAIEDDQFITGALENKAHNIFLETDPDVKTKSKMMKALTGGMYQTIQHKGIDKYSGLLNCKMIFAGNDQDKIKFSDNTVGFRRRINLFEVWYKWDSKKKFLNLGDYYDTTFSEDLFEIKQDISNTILFIYLAMFGIRMATGDYQHSFKFSRNDWKLQYSDINLDLKEKIENADIKAITQWVVTPKNREEAKLLLFDLSGVPLYKSLTLKDNGLMVNNFDEFIQKFLKNEDVITNYFAEYDVYMSIKGLQQVLGNLDQPATFTQNVKKIYGINSFAFKNANRPYLKIRLINDKIKVIG